MKSLGLRFRILQFLHLLNIGYIKFMIKLECRFDLLYLSILLTTSFLKSKKIVILLQSWIFVIASTQYGKLTWYIYVERYKNKEIN